MLMLKKLAVLLGLLILSQTTQAEVRIGVVNIPLLMANAPQAADAKKRLEKEFSPKDKQLVAQQKKIKSLEEKLARDGMTMTDNVKKNKNLYILNLKTKKNK